VQLDEASIETSVDAGAEFVLSSAVELVAAMLSFPVEFPLPLVVLICSATCASIFVSPFSADCFKDRDSKFVPSFGISSEALPLSVPLSITFDAVVIDFDGSALLILSLAPETLVFEVAAFCAGSGTTARSRVEEVAGTAALDLLRFVVLEDDIVVSYSNAVVIMCRFCELEK
jgi:hypothetical protein